MAEQNESGSSDTKNVFLIINQQITPLVRDITRLGRQLDNEIVFQDASISRNHAEIRFEDGLYVLYDQGSTVGTFVNNRRIKRCVLNSGDLISLATVTLMFVNNNARLVDRSSIVTNGLKDKGAAGGK
jgi:pSer/pThr/pTyr-binding forkhead associated (FHA) protein